MLCDATPLEIFDGMWRLGEPLLINVLCLRQDLAMILVFAQWLVEGWQRRRLCQVFFWNAWPGHRLSGEQG
jgi:hypothetical protein